MRKKVLKKNKIVSHFEIEEKAIEKNELIIILNKKRNEKCKQKYI